MDKKEIQKIIATNLRKLMNDQGISITQLPKQCSVSAGTISKIVNGQMSVTIPMAMTIATGLGVDISELMSGLINQKSSDKKSEPKNTTVFNVGIVSINNRRITCVKDKNYKTIGTSELEGGLDLVETSGSLIQAIQESINTALSKTKIDNINFKNVNLNLVMQSYEFEDTRQKFIHIGNRHFKNTCILSDWQVTYFSLFDTKPGVSLIIDKGVSLSYLSKEGLKKLGGWKFPIYDLGGENWLGTQAIQHTIEAYEGFVPMSDLAHNILAKFGGKIGRILEFCFKGSKDADIYCLFCEPLLRSYFTKDPVAIALIDDGFKHVARLVSRADDITGRKNKIAMSGSLTDIYKPMFDEKRLTPSSKDSDKASFLAQITPEYLEKHGINNH